MNACDFDAVVYDGAEYCVGCLPDGVDVDSEEVSPIFASEEMDRYPVCDACGYEHDYVSLTEYGQRERYLRSEPEPIRKLREENDGKLPAYAWPGGYPLVYVTRGGSTLGADCDRKNTGEDGPVEGGEVHWEGGPEVCDECNAEVASADDDPDSPTDDA